MLVYRLCHKDEIDKILGTKTFNDVGKRFETNPKVNTHKYDVTKIYLHFFKERACLAYLNLRENRFICTYDIPNEILNDAYGTGYYLDYCNFERLDSCDEYAIPREDLSFTYLQDVRIILTDIDVDDYLGDEIIDESTRVIYERGKSKRLLYE